MESVGDCHRSTPRCCSHRRSAAPVSSRGSSVSRWSFCKAKSGCNSSSTYRNLCSCGPTSGTTCSTGSRESGRNDGSSPRSSCCESRVSRLSGAGCWAGAMGSLAASGRIGESNRVHRHVTPRATRCLSHRVRPASSRRSPTVKGGANVARRRWA